MKEIEFLLHVVHCEMKCSAFVHLTPYITHAGKRSQLSKQEILRIENEEKKTLYTHIFIV